MARGGPRAGAGRPRKTDDAPVKATKLTANRPSKALGGMTPLEYMLQVMNDGDADDQRRDRMAVAAAPFVHGKAEAAGKKEQRQQAAEDVMGGGRFSPRTRPNSTVN